MNRKNTTCIKGSVKMFEDAFYDIIKTTNNACYTRQALYIAYCKYYNTDTQDLRTFLKEHIAKKLIDSSISQSAFRGTLSRELKSVEYFINTSAFTSATKGFDYTNPTSKIFIDKLASYLEQKQINYAKLFGKTQAQKEQDKQDKQDKQEQKDALLKKEQEALTAKQKEQAKKAGLTLAGYNVLKAFELLSLSEKSKLLKQMTEHTQKALEQAQKAQKAQAKKARDDKNGVKPAMKKAS